MKRRAISLLLVAVVVLAAGCGGGSGTSKPVINSQLFTPNYVDSLDMLLHWNHLPVKVYFSLPSNWTQLYPSNTNLYAEAANEWNWPGQQQMVQIVSDAGSADVTVSFVTAINDPSSTDEVGVTNSTYNSGTLQMLGADIKVAYMPFGRVISAALLQTFIAHELGHALGISGHSPNPVDLMYYAHGQQDAVQVTTADMNTVKTAYPSYFGRAVAPLEGTRRPGEIKTITIH